MKSCGCHHTTEFCAHRKWCPFPIPLPLFPQVQASCSAACTWWKKGKGEGKGHGWGTMATIKTRKKKMEDSEESCLAQSPYFLQTDKGHVLAQICHKKECVDAMMCGPPSCRVLGTQKELCPFPLPLPLCPQVQASCSTACTWWKKGKGEGEGAWVGHHGHH